MILKIGELIRSHRRALGISQEELAGNLCTTSNLSRIENGLQSPSLSLYEALMQRMGQPSDLYAVLADEIELKLYHIRHEIRVLLSYERYAEAELKLLLFDETTTLNPVYRQFALFARAVLEKSNQKKQKMLIEAIALTIPDYNGHDIPKCLLTKDEIFIINTLAISYYHSGNTESAIRIMLSLKKYIEVKVADNEGKAVTYTTVLYNLSKWVGLLGNYEESLRLSEIAISYGLQYFKLSNLPNLIYNKASCLYLLGRKDEALKFYRQAYYIFEAMGDADTCKLIEEILQKKTISLSDDLFGKVYVDLSWNVT